jgi:hypothetical protein
MAQIETTVKMNKDEALVDEIKITVIKLSNLCTKAAEQDLVVTIDQASQDVNGIAKPVFVIRGVFKRIMQPLILRL